MAVVVGGLRVLVYGGYVLVAGTGMFWALAWPDGVHSRRLTRLAAAGITLLGFGTVAGVVAPMVLAGRHLGEAVDGLTGTWLIIRLAVLAFAAFFLVDLRRGPLVGPRRVAVLTVIVLLAATLVTQSNAMSDPWQLVKIIATSGHVMATSAWLGGLLALATTLIPGNDVNVTDRVIPRFSLLATVSIVILLCTGIMHALAVAGGPPALLSSWYGLVLAIKAGLFGVMLLLGNHGRRYAARALSIRRLAVTTQALVGGPVDDAAAPAIRQEFTTLGVVIGAEVALAFAILAVTAVLVAVAPIGS